MHSFTLYSSDRPARHRGFTLVEVLVSLVVLSIGLLGIAKLVMVSSHANDSAYMRSQATALAYQILDNMRANLGGATTGNYTTAVNVMPGVPGNNCVTGACNNAQLAAWDVYKWKQHLDAGQFVNLAHGALPGGTGSVVTSATIPMTATIVVQWNDTIAQSAFGEAVAPNSVTLETVLQ